MDMSWSTARSSSPSLDKPICWAERGEEWADLTKQQTQSLLLASGLSLNSTWIWSDSDPGPSNIDHRSTIHGIHGVRHQTPDTRYQTTDGGGGSWGRVSRVADNGKAQPRSRVTLSLMYVGMGAMKASAKRQIDSWPLWSGKEQPIQVDYLGPWVGTFRGLAVTLHASSQGCSKEGATVIFNVTVRRAWGIITISIGIITISSIIAVVLSTTALNPTRPTYIQQVVDKLPQPPHSDMRTRASMDSHLSNAGLPPAQAAGPPVAHICKSTAAKSCPPHAPSFAPDPLGLFLAVFDPALRLSYFAVFMFSTRQGHPSALPLLRATAVCGTPYTSALSSTVASRWLTSTCEWWASRRVQIRPDGHWPSSATGNIRTGGRDLHGQASLRRRRRVGVN